jgi:hypothetical protein
MTRADMELAREAPVERDLALVGFLRGFAATAAPYVKRSSGRFPKACRPQRLESEP